MPRACSSGRRSVFLPVSASTSAVLPWSMCPAVPTVSGTSSSALPWSRVPAGADGCGGLVRLGVREGQAVEQQAAVAHHADEGRLPLAERRRQLLGQGAGEARELGQGQGAPADPSDRRLDLAAGRGG